MNGCIENKKYFAARILKFPVALLVRLQRIKRKDVASFGNWSGNDTIWRTVNDLNKIIFYADENGEMTDKIQRRMLCIGDMVVGAGEGPLCPEPVKAGCIIMGENPVIFDKLCTRIMGYNYELIPTIKNAYNLSQKDECVVLSNFEGWDSSNIDKILTEKQWNPAKGWDVLRNTEVNVKGLDE